MRREGELDMRRISRMILVTAGYNFRMWKKNMRVIAAFLLAFILCFMLTDKLVLFAGEHHTTYFPVSFLPAFDGAGAS